MTFTVTYRDKDGVAREEHVEAVSRADCFSKCRAKGILPLSMEERRSDGKTRRSDSEARRSKGDARRSNRKTSRSILAVALVVTVLAGGAWWWWSTRSRMTMHEVKVKPRSTALPKEVKPAKAPEPAKAPAKPAPKTPTELKDGMILPDGVWYKGKMWPPGTELVTNANGSIHRKGPFFTPEEAEAFEKLKRDTTLRTHAENLMAQLADIQPGRMVPPQPGGYDEVFDKSFEAAMANEIKFQDEDDDKMRKRKEFVIALKKHIMAEVAKGKKPSEAYKEYVQTMNEVATYRRDISVAAREMIRNGEREEAERLTKDANAELKEIGAEPIDLNRRRRKESENNR